ncbi:MAG: hypothetical protein OQJ97_16960 [Rhodospirillales bacterium]|nr:hypothetical protein [Rhodospirillales bacterium]
MPQKVLADVPISFSPLVRLEGVDDLIREFELESGQKICNLSGWLFSDEYFQNVLKYTRWPQTDYSYSYNYGWEHALANKVAKKIGVPSNMGSVIVHNTSQGITLFASLFAKIAKRQIVIGPYYWSVFENISAFKGDVTRQYLKHDSAFNYQLNDTFQACDAVWITRPPFSTGGIIASNTEKKLQQQSANGTYIVYDEALSSPRKSILKTIKTENIFSLISPHKCLNINGKKFSLISFPKRFEHYFEEYSDSFLGSLPDSTITAAHHFLSTNYDELLSKWDQWIVDGNREVEAVVGRFHGVKIDKWGDSIYRTVFISHLPSDFLDCPKKFKEMLARTGCAVIPGTRNNMANELGFCFRINMTQLNAEYLSFLGQTLGFLIDQKA